MSETFEEFRQSFSYGARNDLSFKFLPRFDDERGGEIIAGFFREIGALLDTGDERGLVEHFIAAQAEGYRAREVHEKYRYEDTPFSGQRSLAGSRVALLTSSGHFAAGDDPNPLGVSDMTQDQAEERIQDFLREVPELSEIQAGASLEVRHGGYDIRGALHDHNAAFPIDRLQELSGEGAFTLHDTAFSFTGACSQGRLLKHALPDWVERLTSAEIDIALLVPV